MSVKSLFYKKRWENFDEMKYYHIWIYYIYEWYIFEKSGWNINSVDLVKPVSPLEHKVYPLWSLPPKHSTQAQLVSWTTNAPKKNQEVPPVNQG